MVVCTGMYFVPVLFSDAVFSLSLLVQLENAIAAIKNAKNNCFIFLFF